MIQYIYIHISVLLFYFILFLSKKLRAVGQCSCAFQDGLHFGRLCTEDIHMGGGGGNKSPVIKCHQCLPYTKASLESRLCGSCRVSGTITVKDGNMESSSVFLQEAVQQCKINVTSYMTEPAKYTTNGKQHLSGVYPETICLLFFGLGS